MSEQPHRALRVRSRRAILVVLLLASLHAGAASAARPRYASHMPRAFAFQEETPIALVPGGAVWYDEGPIEFDRFGVGSVQLGWGRSYSPHSLQSSGDAVAGVLGEGRFEAGLVSGRIRPMYQPVAVPGGECTGGWVPDAGNAPHFVLAGLKIISAGVCVDDERNEYEAGTAKGQPLFLHDVRGGEWRVWRWLRGGFEPPLAVEGTRVAIGEPLGAAAREVETVGARRMRVSVLDARNGAVLARFRAPFGSLAFAAQDRLVVTVQQRPAARSAIRSPPSLMRISFSSFMYALDGRRLADLGSLGASPRISHMHVLTGGAALEVRTLPSGPSIPLVGFNSQRARKGVAFSWPALVVEETTATPLPPDQVNCDTGYYSKPSSPFLQVIDLATPFAFEPAPPPSPLEAQNVLASEHCPIVHYAAPSRRR